MLKIFPTHTINKRKHGKTPFRECGAYVKEAKETN